MPDTRYAQKGPTHGGDDDSPGAAPEAPKAPDLRRYINKPDVNVRDLFWAIMRSYAEKGEVKNQLKSFYGDRMALVRVAVSVVKSPEKYYMEDMSANVVAAYTIQMILDAEWGDVFLKLISETYDRKSGIALPFLVAMQKICETPEYLHKFVGYANGIILDGFDTEGILAYVAELNNPEITRQLKKELIVLATEGIDQSQHFAMFALAPLVNEDGEVKRAVINSLRSWDEETRKIAAIVLKDVKDPCLLETVKKQMRIEDNKQIKQAFEAIIKNNESGA